MTKRSGGMTVAVAPPDERRATVCLLMLDARFNILSASKPVASVPARLSGTLAQLAEQCHANPSGSHASTFREGRLVRLVPMKTDPRTFVLCIERYAPYARLLSALKQFKLSARELDVLLLTLEGKTAAEAANFLGIATSTARDYLDRLLVKTGARNRSALIARVLGWSATSTPSKIG